MEETTNTAPSKAGKGLGVGGFVVSLVALVIYFIVAPIALLSAIAGGGMGLAIFWTLISVVGLALSAMGFMKAKAAGAKKGLALTGIILGLVALLMSVRLIFAVMEVHEKAGDVGQELIKAMGEGMKEGMEQALDSLAAHNE